MQTTGTDILVIANSDDHISEVKHLLEKSDLVVTGILGFNNGIKKVLEYQPLGVILDVKLNEIDGIEACGQIKANKLLENTFIIFYTDEDEEYVQIAALNAGADDYINRPVRSKILQHRVRALIKRQEQKTRKSKGDIISNGFLTIDREKYTVSIRDKNIVLPRKEFELLFLLAANPGKVFSRMELSNKIWGEEQEVQGRTIDVHVRKIREKLGDQLIKTIKGIGYKWNE